MTAGCDEGPPLRIRDATPPDLPAVHRLVGEAGLPLDGLTDAAVVLVAELDDTVVGAIALERHGVGPDIVFLLRSAVVDPVKRGLGIGAELTGAALERVDAADRPVALLTETAEGHFPRFGFTPVDRGDLPAALQASQELRGACPTTVQALLRQRRSGHAPLHSSAASHNPPQSGTPPQPERSLVGADIRSVAETLAPKAAVTSERDHAPVRARGAWRSAAAVPVRIQPARGPAEPVNGQSRQAV